MESKWLVRGAAARGGTWRGVVRGRAVYTGVIHLAHAVRLTLLFLVRSLPYPGYGLCLYPAYGASAVEVNRILPCTCTRLRCSPSTSSMRSRRWDRSPPPPLLADPRSLIGLIVLDRAILIGGATTLPRVTS